VNQRAISARCADEEHQTCQSCKLASGRNQKKKVRTLLGGLERVGAVDDVAADGNREVAADGSGCALKRVGGANQATALANDVLSFPNLLMAMNTIVKALQK
jgi:hypothetical protein